MDWDFLISRMPNGHAIAHGNWEIVTLLRQQWEKSKLRAYPISDRVKNEFKMSMPDFFVAEENYPPPETFSPNLKLPGLWKLGLPLDMNLLCHIENGLVFTCSGSVLMGTNSFLPGQT